jgi:Rad3-related DNA helicase
MHFSIRSKTDWGAIVFIDERFRETRHISPWLRPFLRQYGKPQDAVESLKDFFDLPHQYT